MDREAVIATLGRQLGARREVVAAWLFGSLARGSATDDSDVDVAVLGLPAASTLEESHLGLAADLTSALRRPADLVRVEDASPDLVVRILRDGVLLVDRDPSARIRFEVDARNRYFDMLPVWRTYRRGGRA